MNLGLTLSLVGLLFSSNPIYLTPGGENIAFEIKTDGVIITGTYDIRINKRKYNPSKDADIQKGDIILGVNNCKIDSLNSFIDEFNKYINYDEVILNIKRDNNLYTKNLKLININGEIKTGLYVKERLIGIGTVSFYDTENGIYGALGHEVYDSDSETIVDVRSGSIYESKVIGIKENRNVSEKIADTSLEEELGTIEINSNYGIFGNISVVPSTYTPIKMAEREEVHLGKAVIRTVIKGIEVKEYDIKITKLRPQKEIDIKGIEFDIVDEELIDLGGIYYGMSGSPIIQDDLLVGAVTHVKSSNTNSGYGIYMESMYEYAIENL